MSRVTTQEIMEKLKEIETLIKLDKFLILGYFMITVGIAIISIGLMTGNNVLSLFGFLIIFIGIQSGLIYYMLKTDKEIKR